MHDSQYKKKIRIFLIGFSSSLWLPIYVTIPNLNKSHLCLNIDQLIQFTMNEFSETNTISEIKFAT